MAEAQLAGRVALITGATRGIGAAVARRFSAEGAHVVLIGRTVGALEEIDDAIKIAGGTATLVPLDLKEFDKIDQLAGVLTDRHGKLDILVGNAAVLGSIGPMGHMTPEEFRNVMDINVTANWRLVRAFDPLLRRAPKAHALFTTCEAGHEPTAYWSAYAMSKAALEMMTLTWAAELTKTNVKVALIDPGPVRTGLRRKVFPGEHPSAAAAPEAVASLFLQHVLD
ncbi:MAG TPA: SDR family NAD(P)-dependent oxidoreductase [Stellaceae bacterium]|nr:SDR family NAD(P)-dependent oxidoreductase [Stellaceae bacterium]